MHALIKRPVYMEQLISFREKQLIKVVTGIRRCGKSTLFDLTLTNGANACYYIIVLKIVGKFVKE